MTTNRNASTMIAAVALGAGLLFSASASACRITAWEGTPSAPAPTASSPGATNTTPRWSGECGLQVSAASRWVGDNSPDGVDDGINNPYRARFYVYTRLSGGAAQVFRANSGENGVGTQAFSVTYTPGSPSGSFSFGYATDSGAGSIAGIVPNRWYGVEVTYQSGQPLRAFVVGEGIATESTSTAGANAPATAVGSVRLGHLSGAGTGALAFDDFDSSRSAADRIGWVCRGDADGNGSVGVQDAILIAREAIPPRPLSAGTPDCNRDGEVGIADATCAARLSLPPTGGNCANIR